MSSLKLITQLKIITYLKFYKIVLVDKFLRGNSEIKFRMIVLSKLHWLTMYFYLSEDFSSEMSRLMGDYWLLRFSTVFKKLHGKLQLSYIVAFTHVNTSALFKRIFSYRMGPIFRATM